MCQVYDILTRSQTYAISQACTTDGCRHMVALEPQRSMMAVLRENVPRIPPILVFFVALEIMQCKYGDRLVVCGLLAG